MPDAGCSGTPQAHKLGLGPGRRVALDHLPPDWARRDPPGGLVVVGPRSAADIIVCFWRTALRSQAAPPARPPAKARP